MAKRKHRVVTGAAYTPPKGKPTPRREEQRRKISAAGVNNLHALHARAR